MDVNNGRNEADPRALFRSFSFEVESSNSPDKGSNETHVDDLAVVIVDGRKADDFEAQERAKWRKYFDPWEPSEYARPALR